MKQLSPVLLFLALFAGPLAAEVGWHDGAGNRIPNTESQKSINGFGGMLMTTPDKDWEEKWGTRGVAPQFSTTSKVAMGGQLFILTFFTNPQLDASGKANVTFDIDVKRPDGSTSTHADGAVCFQDKLATPLENVYLCGVVVGFTAEPADPFGTWPVRIKLMDNVRKVTIPLSTTFTLVKTEAKEK